jgi:membrane fusion protein (multidrug efflux system)
MKNAKTPLIIIGLIVVLIVIKVTVLSEKPGAPASAKPTKAPTTNVIATLVKAGSHQTRIEANGTTLSNEEVDLHPESSGKVVEILFHEGDKVKAGTLLLRLNNSDLQATLKKLELQEKIAKDKEGREKKLLDIKGVSQEEYDAALNALQSTQADMEFTRAQIGKTEIRALFDGVIGLKSVSEGSYVSPTVKIASMQQIDPIKIDFFIPEKYSGNVHKGQKLTFKIQGLKDHFEGEIYAIEPKIDMATRTLQLRAKCANHEGKILPGSFARIELILDEKANAILIPTEALVPVLKGYTVFVYKGGKAVTQAVETGTRTDAQIEIISGLQVQDTLITTGIMQLKSGSQVRITELK